jgi:hypothetical protein
VPHCSILLQISNQIGAPQQVSALSIATLAAVNGRNWRCGRLSDVEMDDVRSVDAFRVNVNKD